MTTMPARLIQPQQQTSAAKPASSPIALPGPRPYQFLRHPVRFVRTRLRMMFGKPLSVRWGLDRGLPAHRYYVQLFLREFHDDIRGRCLEFDGSDYLDMFCSSHIEHVDVLNLDASNPKATVIADITRPNTIPDESYDCIICTHVMHIIADLPAAVRGLHRILRPGGVLLCAVPHVSMADEREGELWRFTRLGLHSLLAQTFGNGNVDARAYGNSMIAAGEMRGMIADEYTWNELHTHDPSSAVEVCARAIKR